MCLFELYFCAQVVVLMDPADDDPDDVLRTNRSREKHYVFDYAFDDAASQVWYIVLGGVGWG